MINPFEGNAITSAAQTRLGRRGFMRNAGVFGLGAAAALTLGTSKPALADTISKDEQEQDLEQGKDTVAEILTAALIAEDLATTFYYNVLTGPVIQDVNLAGPGGTATSVMSAGNFGNVAYIRAALDQEFAHANVLRWALTGSSYSRDSAKDPYQTFYFPAGTFDTLSGFTGLLDALENAFISAYLNAIQEFATKAALKAAGSTSGDLKNYTSKQLEYFAKLAATIMGVECEHRALGRVISNSNPANNRQFEQTVHLNAVYNGPASAVVALTPFLTPSTGPGYSLQYAVANQASVAQEVGGHLPLF